MQEVQEQFPDGSASVPWLSGRAAGTQVCVSRMGGEYVRSSASGGPGEWAAEAREASRVLDGEPLSQRPVLCSLS